ncbi:hypothetical protein C8R45DRAFT_827490 [Mycena sanguinolenta]|nr:hypothetical protein C8R45DRAFT_827490 [Mycena sanguinolenta]
MLKKKIPKFALANHAWIGPVPEQLRDLSYAEQVMIAKVRHNRCVMRVNSGRCFCLVDDRLTVVKVYHKLPPSRDEINEVLAFVFLGSAAPRQEDFDRTPMLVRRDKVAEALEWLKLNHEGYSDLEISYENLASYKLHNIPVVVDFRQSKGEPDDSIPVEARSIDDSNEEYDTSQGRCSFAVHGLTAAEYSKHMTKGKDEIKRIAVAHLDGQRSMLGIGRGDVPESFYNNVEAYPGMFPWLFPYGKGGIGHPAHKNKISDMVRKRNLLFYHDK